MPMRHFTVTGIATARLHGGDAIADQRRLRHQAGAEAALLHAVGRAADIEVDLVVAEVRADARATAASAARIAAAELQRDRMLGRIEAEQPRAVAAQHRAGGHHLGVEQRAARQQAMEEPAMPVGPFHHRRDAEAARQGGHAPSNGAETRLGASHGGTGARPDARFSTSGKRMLKCAMQREKEQVALTSIAASAALTVAKGVVGIATGSLAILSEAGHSLIDLGATVMTYVAVRISGKPADAEHHYGHGKVESVSALAETALLFLLSGVVIWEAWKRLIEHEEHVVEATMPGPSA